MQRTTKSYQCHPWRWMLPVFVFLCCDKSLAINIDVAFADVSSDSKIVLVNLDDDDGNGQPDKDQTTGPYLAEDDLQEINVSVQVGDEYDGDVKIEVETAGQDKIKLWADEKKKNALPANTWTWIVPITDGVLQPVKDTKPVKFFVEGIKASATTDDVVIKATLSNGDVDEVKLTLLAVEIKYVDRDVMTNQWAQKKPYDASQSAIYAGPHSGDMIEWRIAGDTLANQSISWEAEHLENEEIITGPSGTGINFWRIADESGNDPTGDEWLKWKPGEYAIFCEIFGERMEVNRVKVGYRSDHVLVIGQIVPTFTHDPDKPTAVPALHWANSVTDDFLGTSLPLLPLVSPTFQNFIYNESFITVRDVFASNQEKGAEAWAGSWAGALGAPPGLLPSWWPASWTPPPATPLAVPLASVGPALSSYGNAYLPLGPLGTMVPSQHYWATQHMLNTNPDTPKVPNEIYVKRSDAPSDDEAFAYIFTEQQYRISHDFQAKFLLDENGKIDQTTFEARHNRAANGPTKMKIGEVDAGDWGTITTPPTTTSPSYSVPLPPFDIKPFPNEPSETNCHNGEISHDSAGKEVSSFATARIGERGRRVSYRQFGKDAPWIFSEIIFAVDDDGNVNLQGRTSTTVQWNLVVKPDKTEIVTVERSPYAPPSTPGIAIFNNLNVYARSEIDRYVRLNGGLLEMEGHLESFVESGSGAWPEPAIPPTVK